MKTLVIYDSKGTIFYQAQGDVSEPEGGLLFLWTEIPAGKILKSIDTTKTEHVAIFEDIPKSELDNVKEQLAAVQIALAEMMGV